MSEATAVREFRGVPGAPIHDNIGVTAHDMSATAGTGLRENVSAAEQAKRITGARLQCDGASIRYTIDGTTPTAALGIQMVVGEVEDFGEEAANLKVIGLAAGSIVDLIPYYERT